MHSQFFSLSECQIIDSLGKVSSFQHGAAYRIHEELCLRTTPSILAGPTQIALQAVNNLFVLQEASSYDILLQTVVDSSNSFSSKRLIRSQFKDVADISILRKNPFSFLNDAPAQHLSLDLTFSCLDTSLHVSLCQYESAKKTSQNFLFESEKF